MGLLGAQLRVEIDDLYGHLFHGHARHDVILCMRDQDVERALEFAAGFFLQQFFRLEFVRFEEMLVGILEAFLCFTEIPAAGLLIMGQLSRPL